MIKEEDRELYVTLFEQNLEHARHVENERMAFVALFLASIGLILSFSSDQADTSPGFAVCLDVLLLVMNIICTRLLIRWNSVINGHFAAAKGILKEMQESFKDDNTMYYFNNRLGLRTQRDSARIKKSLPPLTEEEQKSHERFYIPTASFFTIFNALTYALIAIFLLLHVMMFLGL